MGRCEADPVATLHLVNSGSPTWVKALPWVDGVVTGEAGLWLGGGEGSASGNMVLLFFGVATSDPAAEARLLTTFLPSSLLPSILPQAALEEIHRFSGTYTCMNTFKGRT